MLVSVVIPAYNAQEWISEAIESVLQQTYSELEIVLVDDGSSDRTADVAEESLRKGRLPYRILSQCNNGAAAARNRGWQSAQGQWIQFLDADDRLHPQKIVLQVASLHPQQPFDVVYSDWQKLVWSAGAWKGEEDIRAPTIGRDALADLLSDRNFLQLGCQMFRASTLKAVGGFDKPHEPIEDVGLCVKIAIAGGVFFKANSNGPMSWYRDRPRSFSKTNHRQFIESCIKNAKLAEWHVLNSPGDALRTIEAIIDVYYSGARYFAENDWHRFEEIVSDIERLQPTFVPKMPTQLRVLSRIAGYRKAERLAVLYRKSKSLGASLWRQSAARSGG